MEGFDCYTRIAGSLRIFSFSFKFGVMGDGLMIGESSYLDHRQAFGKHLAYEQMHLLQHSHNFFLIKIQQNLLFWTSHQKHPYWKFINGVPFVENYWAFCPFNRSIWWINHMQHFFFHLRCEVCTHFYADFRKWPFELDLVIGEAWESVR